MSHSLTQNYIPPDGVNFTPVPFKLLRVKFDKGREVVGGVEFGDYAGVPFDAWKRGDLVAVCFERSMWKLREGTTRWTEWAIGRRYSTPSAPRIKINLYPNPEHGVRLVTVQHGVELWRIPHRYQAAAAALIGRDFTSKDELEAAFDQ